MKTKLPVVVAAVFLSGCADTPYYGYNGYNGYGGGPRPGLSNAVKGAGIGALGGAAIGAMSSENRTEGALVGAGVGAVVGGGAGYYMDRQEEQRRQAQSPWAPPPGY
ncbi:YMGG-like glycine zipper-containing protein [Methylogaea oryzae]|nr:glycine zipper domain-containing protein [Methylogaea oryzae]